MKLQTSSKKQKKLNLNFFFPLLKFKVLEKSMVPTILPSAFVLVNRLAYVFEKPKVKDIVLIKNPQSKDSQKAYLIKRIRNINKDKYFVIGDNLKESVDSRKFGLIDRKSILGKVVLIKNIK